VRESDRRLGGQRLGGRDGRQRHARHGGRHRRGGGQRRRAERIGGPAEQPLELTAGGGPVDAARLVPLDDEHVAGNRRDAEAAHEVVLAIHVDGPHDPARRGDLGEQRGHLPAGAAPGGREVEQHDVARRGGSGRVGRDGLRRRENQAGRDHGRGEAGKGHRPRAPSRSMFRAARRPASGAG
jgi:hypothetical protein